MDRSDLPRFTRSYQLEWIQNGYMVIQTESMANLLLIPNYKRRALEKLDGYFVPEQEQAEEA